MPAPRSLRRLVPAGAALALAGALLLGLPASPASAVVTPLHGYRATVDGFTSWYGSYAMAGLGTAWCIDHGIHAPDPAFLYQPADLSSVPLDTQTAMAWVLGRHATADRARSAAVMLVLHDLMDATYPSGPLEVGALAVDQLAGFEGQETSILAQARMIEADGAFHAHLRGPLSLEVALGRARDGTVPVTATVHDAQRQPVAGIAVTLDGGDATVTPAAGTTGADGSVRAIARPDRLPLTVRADAILPRLVLDAWAPSTQTAQRVARPGVDAASAEVTLERPPPTTTTTTTMPPTTTSTVPPPPPTTTTTTTSPPTTTTTVRSTTTTTAEAVAPPSTTTTAPPPDTVPSPAPAVPTLPRTGVDAAGLTLLALGLLLLGAAALDGRRQRDSRVGVIGHHGGHGGTGRR